MALVTFSPVVYSQFKRRDGTYTVKIRITFRRKSKFIPTNITVRQEQMTRSLKLRDSSVRMKVNELVSRMEQAVSGIDMFSMENMTIDDIINCIARRQSGTFRLDFVKFAGEVISGRDKKQGRNYRSALNAFTSFIGRDSIDISQVTSSLMRGFERWLVQKHGDGARAISQYTAAIAFMHKQARLKYNDEETGEQLIKNPFEFYKPPKQRPSQHRGKDIGLINDMIRYRKELSGRERLGVDVYLLSFCLMGMNSPDLYGCSAPDGDVLHYFRTKTTSRRADKAEMYVRIDSRVLPIADEYRDRKGRMAFDFYSRYAEYEYLGTAVNLGLRQFARRIGIAESLTLYSARHTWASLAHNKAGISKGVVNDCLCHVDEEMRVTDIYINKDWTLLWDANTKVLDLLNWENL